MSATLTDLQFLLRAILIDPADDFPRIQLADALEEDGQTERAEFIRVQVELAEWKASELCVHNTRPHYKYRHGKTCITFRQGGNCPCKGQALAERNRLMLNIAYHHWLPVYAPGMESSRWHRGFISEAHLPLAAFMDHAAALFAAHPITAVTLTDREPNGCHFAGSWAWSTQTPKKYADDVVIGGSAALDLSLFDLLDGHIGWLGGSIKLYESRDAAINAVPRACVIHGRNLNGLLPLEAHG